MVSFGLLVMAHYLPDPPLLELYLPATSGGDGILWQVQTTFLSVGFAGLTIAAQLFAETPLAIGASRGRILEHIGAGFFVGVGLAANALIAIETIWLPSAIGLLAVWFFGFVPTVGVLVASTIKLTKLFGRPSQLDEVVRSSLVETISSRLGEVSSKYESATKDLDDFVSKRWPVGMTNASMSTVKVPVTEGGRVIKMIRPRVLRQAVATLSIQATEGGSTPSEAAEEYTPPQIRLELEPGDRTKLGETAFLISTSKKLDDATTGRVIRLLQSSVEYEAPGSVTPYEETDRDIANLKDAIGTSLRVGALGAAERALGLLREVVRGVWMVGPESMNSSRRASYVRRDWLFRSIGEVEQDALLSPRIADIFVTAAMTRALEASRFNSADYVNDCLASFTRLWLDLLRHGGSEFETVTTRIITCVQNLAAYTYPPGEGRDNAQARAIWALVELVKLALDAKNYEAAKLAAEELKGLFEFASEGAGRSHVRGGQLVLSGWIDLLTRTGDKRAPDDPSIRQLVTAYGTYSEILAGRLAAEQDSAHFSRWDWWEMKVTGSSRVQTLQLSHFVDQAQLSALASSYGPLPRVDNQERASEYGRLLRLLGEAGRVLSSEEESLKRQLEEGISLWEAGEDARLTKEPLSRKRIETLRNALREATNDGRRLAAEILVDREASTEGDDSLPILGMNLRVPRHYLVDPIFNETHADPSDLGLMIARGFAEGEEQKIVSTLRGLGLGAKVPAASEIQQAIEEVGDEAKHYILLTPYGGFDDFSVWHSPEFRAVLTRVTHLEIAALEDEAFLFDRRNALRSRRHPETGEGLTPVEGTSIALGIFEDVQDADEPQVRIETGEYFVVWPVDEPRVVFFGINSPSGNAVVDDAPPQSPEPSNTDAGSGSNEVEAV